MAARMTMPTIAYLNFLQRKPAVTKPNMERNAARTGISKIAPKPRSIMFVISRYSLIMIMGVKDDPISIRILKVGGRTM